MNESESQQGSEEPPDFLKLNEEGHHKIAYDYIESLQAQYSKEDLDKAYEGIQKLRNYLFELVYELDFSLSFEERARASVETVYAPMAADDKDGLIILSYLEVFYKRYRRHSDELCADNFFQELLSLALHVMKDPKLLKQLYNFPNKK